MAPKAFTAELRNGVLELWLDTPNSDFNVFTDAAAVELLSTLEELDVTRVSAVVLRSRKPGSFVNGVGLLMASAARSAEDVTRLSANVRRAFRALRALPIPTISAIQGNCYGCGVELSLHTSYRVADRAFDTHFFMTELAEYLFLPVFGATQDLPRLLGLESAADFLLWGERWSADEACCRGLVDACFAAGEFEAGLSHFVHELLSGAATPARAERSFDRDALPAIERRIAALPPRYRDLYADCLSLMQRSLREGSDYAGEIAASARSVLEPRAKAALSLFFVRQVAKRTALRHVAFAPVEHVALRGQDELAGALRARQVRRLLVTSAGAAGPTDADLTLEPYAEPSHARGSVAVAEHDDVESAPHWQSSAVAYWPVAGVDFVEIAAQASSVERARAYDLFTRAGFAAIVSRPSPRFASDVLIAAYLAPLVSFLEQGGAPEDAACTLRDFGFVQLPSELLSARREFRPLSALASADARSGHGVSALLGAVLLSLLSSALELLRGGTLEHVSQLDVLARAALDFPLCHGSLGRYLSIENVSAQLRDVEAGGPALVPAAVLERAEEYLSEARPFYR
jgi:enoyl-CoA hydratase/carnithine racemase